MNSRTTDISKHIVLRCQQGDTEAYNELYRISSRPVFNSIVRIVQHREDAEDILQDTYMSVFKSIAGFNFSSSVITWIKRIGINKSINEVKKRKLPVVEEQNEIAAIHEEKDLDYGQFEAVDIARCIESLPDGYRWVLSLYLLEDYSHQEIADQLKISLSTSKSQYLRGKQKLKKMLLNTA